MSSGGNHPRTNHNVQAITTIYVQIHVKFFTEKSTSVYKIFAALPFTGVAIKQYKTIQYIPSEIQSPMLSYDKAP